ncbi:MAG: preprotein translocase subunit SecE [Patescibacteria group bacterium]
MATTVKKIKLDSKKSGKKTTDTKAPEKSPKNKPRRKVYNPLAAFFGYVTGSWDEIRQVRWPNRKATWGMTLAVIAFTLFFSAVILILDSLFQILFKDFLLK